MRIPRDDAGSVWIDWHVGGISTDDLIAKIDTALGNAFWRTRHGLSINWLTENWTTATSYQINDALHHNGSGYICVQAHTSAASSEPNQGASWTDYWDLLVSQGPSGPGSGDLLGANNLNDVASPAASRSNLGLGTAAVANLLDQDDMASNDASAVPSQQSTKAYADNKVLDEDDFVSDSETQAPSQQSVSAYLTSNIARADIGQALSNAYKQQARTNISAAAASWAAAKNYIINPGMRISQENGTTSGTASGYYAADQWRMDHSQDGTLTLARVASATPGGSTHRVRCAVPTADASLAAGQYAWLFQPLEGVNIADLKFGTSDAKDVVLRFGWKSPAGTYAICLVNTDNSRTYTREFTIAPGDANTDTVQTVTFPGDTSGTWGTGASYAMGLVFTIAAGSTFQGTADQWNTSQILATTSTSNGIGTSSAVFELFDVGMYADPDSTGAAPPFVLPGIVDDQIACQRYFQVKTFRVQGYNASGQPVKSSLSLSPPMRTSAGVSASGLGAATGNMGSWSYEAGSSEISFSAPITSTGSGFKNEIHYLSARM